MSKWNHSICVDCWNKKNTKREPIRLREELRSEDVCCYCGEKHKSGIFVREDPAKLVCRGDHL